MEKGLLYNEEDVDYLRARWLALSGEHLGPKYWTLFETYYREP